MLRIPYNVLIAFKQLSQWPPSCLIPAVDGGFFLFFCPREALRMYVGLMTGGGRVFSLGTMRWNKRDHAARLVTIHRPGGARHDILHIQP